MPGETREAAVRYHKRTLLETADRLLSEFGYDGMNMNMLAKEAGYSKATVYVYMESKDEIVRQLSVERLKVLRGEFKLVVKNDMTTEEKLGEVKTVLDDFVAEDRVYFDFISKSVFAAAESDAPDSAKQLSALVEGILDDLSALAPVHELKRRWYAYYGEVMTRRMFGE